MLFTIPVGRSCSRTREFTLSIESRAPIDTADIISNTPVNIGPCSALLIDQIKKYTSSIVRLRLWWLVREKFGQTIGKGVGLGHSYAGMSHLEKAYSYHYKLFLWPQMGSSVIYFYKSIWEDVGIRTRDAKQPFSRPVLLHSASETIFTW